MSTFAITIRASVQSELPAAAVEEAISDVLGPLAEDYGVTIDEILVREGDGL